MAGAIRVFVLGATGFLGRALCLRLARDGHTAVAWLRDAEAARSKLGAEVEIVQADEATLVSVLSRCEAVVNLAGASIGRRWTARVRAEAARSRIDLTRRLVEAIGKASPRPRVLVQGTAIGIYGDRGDEVLTEESDARDDFLADLCVRWEAEARRAEDHGVRVACIRTGVVLGIDGGALAAMLPTTRLGFGAVLGNGRQHMPWIHRSDIVEMLATAVVDARWEGAFNGVAPHGVDARELADALARALGRPRIFRVPAIALRLALGEAAAIVLASQRAVPRRALALGLPFRFPMLAPALGDVLHGARPASIVRATSWPDSPAFSRRAPTHALELVTAIERPIDEVWAFFERPQNLAALTPGDAGFRFVGELPERAKPGDVIDARVAIGPWSPRFRTRIEAVEPARRFFDHQEYGPFGAWAHEHVFEADGARTRMIDRVWYAAPFGPIGRAVQALAIAPRLLRLFAFRSHCVALRFGAGG